MGFFNFLKGKKNNEEWIEIYSPLNGRVISLSEVPDEAFAQKAIGDGCAIEPVEGAIYAPVDGEAEIFRTLHAVSMETSDGIEMIVHFGIDTVKLDGEGFRKVAEDGEIKKGDKLIEYNLDFIKENAKSTRTPVIIANMDIVETLEVTAFGEIKAEDLLMRVKLKERKNKSKRK